MKRNLINRLTIFSFALLIVSCIKVNDGPEKSGFNYNDYYTSKPDINNCVAGILNDKSKQTALDELNYIRSLHNLQPVTYNSAYDNLVQQSALISAANDALSHTPTASYECYTTDGATGSSESNLALFESSIVATYTDQQMIDGWLTEDGSTAIGHRRWVLDPFLKYVSYGRVDGKPKKGSDAFVSAGSLKVINDDEADITDLAVNYIAYPYGNYPTRLFPKNLFLSFSALYDKTSTWANSSVTYQSAVVQVALESSGQQLAVSSVSYDNEGYGIPNSIQWKVNGLKDNTSYVVSINNVSVNGVATNYQYKFTLVK